MPTVLRSGPYRVYFYSHQPNEPAHVDRDDSSASFWLRPLHLARSRGFTRVEIGRIQAILAPHVEDFLEAWHEHFGH